jgi:ADP-ribosylglycohydrolase
MGVPAENLSPNRVAALFPNFDRPAFVFGYGMSSDDTEHACLTAGALALAGGDLVYFRSRLAARMRWWFLAGPAGIGKATLLSCLKLWLGFPSKWSGVWSAGNGPAMRAAVLGSALPENKIAEFVRASTRITHRDPKAEYGALVVAVAANAVSGFDKGMAASEIISRCKAALPSDPESDELRVLLDRVLAAVEAQQSVAEFAASLGLERGVTGYMYHTVPVALFAWLRHRSDYRTAIESVIRCGGDTDTVAAIAGSLLGCELGADAIPPEWLNRYRDFPFGAGYIRWIGRQAAFRFVGETVEVPLLTRMLFYLVATPFDELLLAIRAVLTLPRNLFFFAVVMAHVVRRMLPPY